MDETQGAPRETATGFSSDASSWLQLAAAVGVCALLIGAGVYILSGYLHALAWAVVFAVALWPLYTRVRRRRVSGEFASLLFTALVGFSVMAPVALLAAGALVELRQLVDYARMAGDSGLPAPEAIQRLPYVGAWITQWWAENLAHAGWAKDLLKQLNTSSTRELGAMLGAGAVRRAMLFIVCLLALFFLFLYGDSVVSQSRVVSRRLFGARGEVVAGQMIASVRGTLNGLVLVAIGEGFILTAAYVVTHTPHPILLGALTTFAAMIPFAAAIAIGVAALVAAVSVGAPAATIIVAVGAVTVFVADHFVRPQLIGATTKMPFVWVLLGILGGVECFELLGLFLGPAIMAALISLWRDLSAPPEAPLG
ncbi:MAG: AI-2E family transporter [Methylocystis sp.]|uniref:AI-2E family transporter n=1 Tax=Methylocystis sp. TaxID=1911079 RepID=UPI003DA3D7B9